MQSIVYEINNVCDQIPLWGTKNPQKFASLPICGFIHVVQLVVVPNQYLGGTGSSPVQAH